MIKKLFVCTLSVGLLMPSLPHTEVSNAVDKEVSTVVENKKEITGNTNKNIETKGISANYATTFTLSDWGHTDDGTYITLNNYTGSDVDIYVPGEHAGKQVRLGTSSSLFTNITGLKTVRIAEVNGKKVLVPYNTLMNIFNHAADLEELDLRGLDVSNVISLQQAFANTPKLRSVDVDGWDTSSVTTLRSMFTNSGIESFDANDWDTGSVLSMESTFANTPNLTSVDIGNWDVSNVTTFKTLFYSSGIVNLDLKNWDPASVIDMQYTFNIMTDLETLDVSNWDVSNATTMYAMFSDLPKLEELDVSKWRTSSLKDASFMFYKAKALKSLDLNDWGVSTLENMYEMFAEMEALEELNIKDWDISNVINMDMTFMKTKKLKELDVKDWDISGLTSLYGTFSESGIETLAVEDWDTSNVTSMEYAFWKCENLKTLPVEDWDTGDVFTMASMFEGCTTLEELNTKDWDTSSVLVMNNMFSEASSLKSVAVEDWDVSNVSTINAMFNKCYALEDIDVTNWDTSSVMNMDWVFYACVLIEDLDVSNWDTSNVFTMAGMFDGLNSLKSLDVSKWDTSNVTSMEYMFAGLTSLENILDLSDLDVSNVTTMKSMFQNSESIVILDVSDWILHAMVDTTDMFKCENPTQLVLVYTGSDPKLTTYNYANDNREFLSLDIVLDATTGEFAGGAKQKNLGVHLTDFITTSMNTLMISDSSYNNFFSSNIPTLTGNTFSGWDHALLSFTGSKIITELSDTFNAQWLANSYGITYHLDGGTNGAGNPTTYTYGSGVASFTAPTKVGYTFKGWYKDAGCTTSMTNIPTTQTGVVDVYAKWEANKYNISYYLNGGTNDKTNPTTYTYGSGITSLKAPTKEGYNFNGWYKDASLTTPMTSISTTQTGTVNVYAKWTLKKLTIKDDFKANDDNILVVYRSGDKKETSLLFPTGYSYEYDIKLEIDGTPISANELKDVTWKVKAAGECSDKLEYVTIKNGTNKLIAKRTGIVTLSATYKGSTATIDVVVVGDVTRDGILNTADALRIQNYASSKTPNKDLLGVNDKYTELMADMSGDAIINTADKVVIQKMVAKTIKPSN